VAEKKFRWRYFIDKPFQIRFIGRFLILIVVGLAISIGALLIANATRYESNLYFQVKDADKINNHNATFYEVVEPVPVNIFEIQVWPMVYMSALFIILIIAFGLFISHKMAGPVHRIKITLKDFADGKLDIKETRFKLRKRDELQDLVDAYNSFLDSIEKKLK